MKKHKAILFPFIKLSFNQYKPYFFVLIGTCLLRAGQAVFGAYTLSLLIKALEANDKNKALIAGCVLVGVEVILAFLVKLFNRLLTISKAKMEEAISQMISKKILSVPFSYLEDPYYMEIKKDAEQGINNMGAIYLLLDSFAQALSSILTIISLSVILITFDPLLIVVLIVGIILMIIMVVISLKTQVTFFKDLLPLNYKYSYYIGTLLEPKNNKELRLYPVYDIMSGNFCSYGKNIVGVLKSIVFKMSLFETISEIIKYVEMAFVYSMVGIRTIVKNLPISSFSLSVSSAIAFSDAVSKILDSSSNFIRSIEYIKPVMELMSLKEMDNTKGESIQEIESIEFRHVTFSYPKTKKVILNDISFKVNKGEKISVVGLNGAGKTTIVKLLCLLYDVNQGEIIVNGKEIHSYNTVSYMKLISAVFQDYKLFAYSILENIRPGISLEEAKKLCSEVGIADKIESLPYQYESTMKKGFDEKGIELSGGQQQKIAIARALANEGSLLILDEPTSALDPLAEAEIYENFNELAKNKTAIYISHRMSSSIFCDKILVLDGGVITDFDSHQNLMKKKDSLYYKLFTTQAKNYQVK